MTAFPIVETQAGDISAYIPTNIISITDGQIFLDGELFNAGQRPAVNIGLSVSRVGGSAQTNIMKKAVGTLRLDLAQYREMQVFSQFGSDLDEQTKRQLKYGAGLMQLLRQKNRAPLSLWQQVVLLMTAQDGQFMNVPASLIGKVRDDFLAWFEKKHGTITLRIEHEKMHSQELREEILEAGREYFRESFSGKAFKN